MAKVALITGGNKGIGLETARQLGKKGTTVLISVRDEVRGREALQSLERDGITAGIVMMQPTDSDSITAAVHDVEKRFGGLDILINNAGTLVASDYNPPASVSLATFRETFELNVFALHDVTSRFWPLLNRSSAARIVNVSSMLGSLTKHADGSLGDFKVIAYDSSKAAVNMMTIHYAHQWKNTPHRANAVHPGSVKTDLNPHGELTVEEGARTSVRLATIPDDGPNGGFYYFDEPLPW